MGSYWKVSPSRFLINAVLIYEGGVFRIRVRKIRKLGFGPEIYSILFTTLHCKSSSVMKGPFRKVQSVLYISMFLL